MPGYIEIKGAYYNVSHFAEVGKADEMYDVGIESYFMLSNGEVIGCPESLDELRHKIMHAMEEGNMWG